jgi:endonuclease/exonuclease/phosphatase family metal-dependent hydrolase
MATIGREQKNDNEERSQLTPNRFEPYALIESELKPHFSTLSRCQSTAELHHLSLYRELEPVVRRVLTTPDVGSFTGARTPAAPEKDRYRIVAWNLERGIELDGQLEALRRHPYLRGADLWLLTETDVGMARSGNRDVARTLARELGLHYAFAPCYINLAKGAGREYDASGENTLGLHGNAILSRYPLERARVISLENGKDKMAGREKRLGNQAALAADVALPGLGLTAVAVHLDAQSTQRHRRNQMGDILEALEGSTRAVIGGDWNTTTHDSSRAFPAIMGYWLRVALGIDRSIDHYLHPYRWFERELFDTLERNGFDYRGSNVLGERTMSYDVSCGKTRDNLGEWIPDWCFAFIRWALRNHDGRCPLKVDWFATRGLSVADPIVLHEFREGLEAPLSDHDAIGLELRVGESFS